MNATAITPEAPLIGHPACPARFMEAVEHLPVAGPARVMVPPVTPAVEAAFSRLLHEVADRGEVELSLNDWGALYRCAQLKRRGALRGSLTLGVLLAGQDTDPILAAFCRPQPQHPVMGDDGQALMARWAPPPEDLLRHWRTPSAFEWIPLLRELGVTRLELSAQPLLLPEQGPGLPVTLIRPAIVSVAPCRGRCDDCRGPDMRRGSVVIRRWENLLLSDLPMALPGWVDRVVSLEEEGNMSWEWGVGSGE